MLNFSIRKFVKILLIVTAVLSIFNLLAIYSEDLLLEKELLVEIRESFVRLFSVDREANVPTWFSSSMLLLCSLLLFLVAEIKKSYHEKYISHWFILTLVFLGLSLDEAAIIHEMSIKPIEKAFHTRGLLRFGWIVPAAIFVIFFYWIS